jgi:two-component system NtrC family sensor kinase
MAAGLAHEINTPLSNIRALAALAGKDIEQGTVDAAALAGDLADIGEQTRKCSQIISALLGFARKQKSEFVLHDINSLVEKSLHLVRIKADKKNVLIDFKRHDEVPRIKVDGHQIEQVCVNILLNAIDAVEPGGRVRVESEFSGAFVAIRFIDTGSGVEPHIIGKIFDPFFTTKGVGKGTGLGLSLSYGIVKNHGGTITVANGEEGGTVFTVMLPTAGPGGFHDSTT